MKAAISNIAAASPWRVNAALVSSESDQIVEQIFGMGGVQAVRRALVDLERRTRDQAMIRPGDSDGDDLVGFAMDDQGWNLDRRDVRAEVGIAKGLDAFDHRARRGRIGQRRRPVEIFI